MQAQADVIVVGAGPAGSFAALTAVKVGNDVIICEEHKEVGLPSHCPGHISIKGLDKLGLHVADRIIENRIAGAHFYSPSGTAFKVKFPSPVTYSINRPLFDRYLAQLAEKAGAKVQNGTRVEKLLLDKNSVHGVSLKGAKEVKSSIVIDAEGCASTLLKQVGLQTFDKRLVVAGISGEVACIEGLEDDTVEVYLGQQFAAGLYAWIMPKRDGSAKVGLATKTGNPREHLKHFLNTHPVACKKLRFNDVKNLSYHLIPLGGPIPKTYHNGLLVVGDAASQVKPTTGGGVIMGLTCARIAGETAAKAVQSSNFSEGLLSDYQKRWRKAIGFDMAVMRRIRLMLNRLPDDRLDRIISLCSQFHMSDKLLKVRDIDLQGKAMFQLLKSPSACAVAIYALLSSLAS